MGRGSSRPAPPPDPLLHRPWREINWSDKHNALLYVNEYRAPAEGQQLRVLLYGLVGAGKSSFINSVNSVLRGRMCVLAQVDNTSQSSCTKKYTTYRIRKGDAVYPFVLNDMMGLHTYSRRNRKVHVKDVKRLMKGNVRDGYTFNPQCSISKEDRFYNPNPTVSDKVHVVVFVVDANTESLMNDAVVETIHDIRDEASDLGIPQVVIFTKIDEVAPEIKEDVTNVYRSRKLQQRMQQFSADVGLQMNSIFAVQNYTNTNLKDDADVLLLDALRHIMDYGDDLLKKLLDDQGDSES